MTCVGLGLVVVDQTTVTGSQMICVHCVGSIDNQTIINQSIVNLYNGAIVHQQVMSQRRKKFSARSAKCEEMHL